MITLKYFSRFSRVDFCDIFQHNFIIAAIVFLHHTSIAQERTLLFVKVYFIEH